MEASNRSVDQPLPTVDGTAIRENIAATAPVVATSTLPTMIDAQRADLNARALAAGGGEDDSPSWEEVDEEPDDTKPPVDFRETRVHFGKKRGLMLSELSPQQVHWYETDWMVKKQAYGPTSVEDLALIDALNAYRDWTVGTALGTPSAQNAHIHRPPTPDRRTGLGHAHPLRQEPGQGPARSD